ncbi:MAG: S1C family serine protease [Phycisphaerales bacterium]
MAHQITKTASDSGSIRCAGDRRVRHCRPGGGGSARFERGCDGGGDRGGDASWGAPAEELQVVELFERVSASVAYVDTRRVVEGRGFFMEPRRQVVNGTGSAFIWDTDGHVVTNFHVIQDANSAQVVLSDGSTWPAGVDRCGAG